MKHKSLSLAIILCLLTAGSAFAQLTPQGKIIGQVVDSQGSPLPGVVVEATSPKLLGKAATTTDATGTYRLMALPSGLYEITFTMPGFKTVIRKDVYLELSQTLVLNEKLEQAAVQETVTVVGHAPLIDVKSTVKGQVMTKDVFLSLPRGRTFDSLISTIPGVQNEPITGGISVDGASGAENMWYADGADITDFHLGIKGQNAVLELLDEVKVTASGYNAEYGGSMGGVVNVITRSGGNEFHGDIMGYYENNSRLMQGHARTFLRQNPFDDYDFQYVNYDDLYFNGGKDRDKYNRYEGVFSLGGYFIKDKLWFFGSFNPVYYQTSALRDFNLRDGPFSTFKNKNTDWGGSIRISAAPVKGLRLSASFINNFTKYRGDIPDIIGDSDSLVPYQREGYDYPNSTLALTADYSVGNNLLISYRGGYHMQNTNNQQVPPSDSTNYTFIYSNSPYNSDPFYVTNPSLIHLSGWNTDDAYYLETRERLQDKIQNNIDVSYYANWMGEHALKAGVGYTYLHENVYDGQTHPRVWLYWGRTYTGLGFPVGVGADPYLADGVTPNPYYGPYGYYYVRGITSTYGGIWNIHSNNMSFFVQDSWTIKNKLTLNFGVRAEGQYIPSMTNDTSYEGFTTKPVKFSLMEDAGPPAGRDLRRVRGFQPEGLRQLRHLLRRHEALHGRSCTFGGWKRTQDYYALNNPDWTQIAASGVLDDRTSGSAGGTNTYAGVMDFLPPSFEPRRPGPEADRPEGDLLRRREEAAGGPVRLRPLRPEAPHPDDRGRRRANRDQTRTGRRAYSRTSTSPTPASAGRGSSRRAASSPTPTGPARRRPASITASTLPWKNGSATTGRAASITP